MTLAVETSVRRWEVLLETLADARVAAAVARDAAMSEGLASRAAVAVATAAAELATNVIRHGKGGCLTVEHREGSLWLTAEDRGDGCEALLARAFDRAAADPRSHGIGAVARLMDGVRIARRQGGGLAITVWKRRSHEGG